MTTGSSALSGRNGDRERPEPVEHVMAVYGTLKPGESNHHVVSMIEGHWFNGQVRGRLGMKTWGTYHGYPALRLDQAGDRVPVAVLVSPQLPAHWDRLDAFEGPEYRRVEVEVEVRMESDGHRDGGADGATAGRWRALIYEVLAPHELDG